MLHPTPPVLTVEEKIRAKIRLYRQDRHLSIREISKMLYMTKSQYHQLESGSVRIDIQRLISILTILEVDVIETLSACMHD